MFGNSILVGQDDSRYWQTRQINTSMYVLFVTWLTLVPPYYGEEQLYVYKDKQQCEWAKTWVEENNDIRPTWKLGCRIQ